MNTPLISSRLPHVGNTIFSVMSALAAQYQAVNLGQGFPDFDCDIELIDSVTQAMQQGHNQYPPMAGVPVLRDMISDKVESLYRHHYDPQTEITVTAGATQAIMCAIQCCVHPGDEVIVIEPAYDCYLPVIELTGARAVTIAMQLSESGFCIPWDRLAASITPKTRLIILNTPNNPTGSTLSTADFNALADILRRPEHKQILILSDEVYEHMVYDGKQHISICSHPELVQRAFVISSFGKTFHVTGWKVGYLCAPVAMSVEFISSPFSQSIRRCSTGWLRTCRTRNHIWIYPIFIRSNAICFARACPKPDSGYCRSRALIFNAWITGKFLTCRNWNLLNG